MSNESNNFHPIGIAPEGKLHDKLNDSGQSKVLEFPDKVMIVREASNGPNQQMAAFEEIKRRSEALKLYKKRMKNLPKNSLALLQGVSQKSDEVETLVPVIGRLMEKFQDVTPSHQIPVTELLSNSKVAGQIADINLGYLKIVLLDNKVPDIGRLGLISNSNILVGTNSQGEKVAFPDPDWSDDFKGRARYRFRKKVQFTAIFISRYLLFKTAAMVDSLRDKLKSL